MNNLTGKVCCCMLIIVLGVVVVVESFQVVQHHNHHHHEGRRVVRSLASSNDGNDMGELTSALARLDSQWQIQQMKPGKKKWTKLIIPKDDEQDSFTTDDASSTSTDGDIVYLLEPDSSIGPSCLLLFTGGAGLGQFPHVAYEEFLMRLSSRMNAAILTAPYSVGLDHFTLAKQSGELLRKAIIQCQDNRGFSENMPIYSLAHSLGAKLQTIHMAATGVQYDGVGFLSYNNFGFAQTITMARSFAKELRENTFGGGGKYYNPSDDILNNIFNIAENVVGSIGIEFQPSPDQMDKLIDIKYDDTLKKKTRLFVFDDDKLDNSRNFWDICRNGGRIPPSASLLQGTHLTPVYFKFTLDDALSQDIPPEAAEFMASSGAVGGFQEASFGNEEDLTILVNEVCGWILGKSPSKEPLWTEQDSSFQGVGRIAGGSVEDTDVDDE